MTELLAPLAVSPKQSRQKTAAFILSQQKPSGAIPWFEGGQLDPWDHTEAAMGLSIAGHWPEAERAYQWLADNQLPDGSWNAEYFTQQPPHHRETNFIAYVATGVWHHFLISQNLPFLMHQFPMVMRAINCVLRAQSQSGEIAWAISNDGRAANDALITGCASILRSLECAVAAAKVLNVDCEHWMQAGRKLKTALLYKPYRFDRHWPSKSRYAMDWYYPILAGLYSPLEAKTRLQKQWPDFVQEGLGCHCVLGEPWVTLAETSELAIACVAAGLKNNAKALLTPLENWCTKKGAYWTGYVYKDDTIWPEETTTWTAGAVLLAGDALHRWSPAHELFTRPTLF